MFKLQYAEYISTIQCMEEGAYHYDMPDFSTKYGNIDLFNMFLKIYVVLKRIFSGEGTECSVWRETLIKT